MLNLFHKRPNGLFRAVPELISEAARLNPYPWLAEMRAQSPLRWDEERNCWDVFLYEDAVKVLSDPAAFRSAMPEHIEGGTSMGLLTMDPPRHAKMRALAEPYFTEQAVHARIPQVRALMTDLIASVRDSGRMDLVRDVSFPMPVLVMCEMMGVPPEDRMYLKECLDEITESLVDEGGLSIQLELFQKFLTQGKLGLYFLKLLAERRIAPEDDMISMLLRAEIDGEQLGLRDVIEYCALLVVGGFETTTNLIANAMRCFLDEPELLERLRADKSLLPAAIEEVLRFRSPLLAVTRFATQDVVLRNHLVKAGDQLVVWIGSANRDEEAFPDAELFRHDRQPNPHIAFSRGPHHCIGSQMARMEALHALDLLLDLPGLRYADRNLLKPAKACIAAGISEFPVTFDA